MPVLKNRRIVHIISGLGQGGAETVLYRITSASQKSYHHHVISLGNEGSYGPALRDAGIRVTALNMHGMFASMKALKRLWSILRKEAPDMVQTWMVHADLVGGVIARLAGVPRLVWGLRNAGATFKAGSRATALVQTVCVPLSYFIPDTIIACAYSAANAYKARGYSAKKMQVIPNGYVIPESEQVRQNRVYFRQEWKADDHTMVLACVARWHPVKGHRYLFQALSLLKAQQQMPLFAWRLVLIGKGMEPSNSSLMALLKQHGLEENIVLLGSIDNASRLMPAFDIHILASLSEGFPNVVAETMAVGVPNIATRAGDAASIIDNTGWLTEPGSAQELARALKSAMQAWAEPAWAERCQQARHHIASHFSQSLIQKQWESVWNAPEGDKNRVLFIINNPAFFISHRLNLALAAKAQGYEVHVATPQGDAVSIIREQGLHHHVIAFSRSGRNPLQEIRRVWELKRLFQKVKPQLVHAVTIKPVLYGGIAARWAGVPAFVAAISGLGYVFTAGNKHKQILKKLVAQLYKWALKHKNSRIIVQNEDDWQQLQALGAVREEQKVIVCGSGVNLEQFFPVPEPASESKVIVCVSRMLKDKGIVEFVQAAKLSKKQPVKLRWQLIGGPDSGNPSSLSREQLLQWQNEGVIEWLGERTDIAACYAAAHIAVLPSYREGMPKSLLEAAACGRAIVTTDVPGCRDAIENGVSGMLVPPANASALAQAVFELASDDERRHAMGRAGRALAERVFDERKIVAQQLAVYSTLLN